MSVDIRPNPASSGAVSGGLVYKGSYNVTTNNPDLTTSTQGDFYIVNPDAGTLAGVAVNVGDHIVFNQDAASPLTSAMFDVIDNTDAVVSVNGQTGPVVLGASDVSALAIADNLNDLANKGTARTNLGVAIGSDVQAHDAQLDDIAGLTPTDSNFIVGNGSNFITESGATARTSLGLSIGSDVQAHDAQLDDIAGLTPTDSNFIVGNGSNFVTESGATARTSLGLTIGTDVQAHDAQLDDIAGLATTDGGFIVGDGSNFVLESGATARASLSLGSAALLEAGANTANQLVQLDASARLPAVDGSLLTNITATDSTRLLKTDNLSDLPNKGTARTNLGVAIGSDVQAHSAKLDDVAGLATTDGGFIVGDGSNFVLESGATARASLSLGSAALLEAGANTANQLVQLTAAAKLPAVDGSLVTNITATDSTRLLKTDNLSDLPNKGTARTNLGVAIGSDVQAHDAQLDDIAGLTPTDSNFIVGNGSNFVLESGATARTSLGVAIGSDVQAHSAKLDDVAGLATTDGGFIVGDGSNFVLESGATARASLSLGSAALLEAGANTANQLVQLDASARLPAVDGSLLTNLPGGGGGTRPTVASITSDTTISNPAASVLEQVYLVSGSTSTVTLPTASGNEGLKIQIKNMLSSAVTVDTQSSQTIDTASSASLTSQFECLTFISDDSNWVII